MSTPEQLRRQAEAVARVRAARVQRDKAVASTSKRLKKAIQDAASSGASVADIALAADLSKQRIYQVIHERDR
jgi:hypothetical protein